MAAGVSAAQSVMVLEKRGEGKLRTPALSALMSLPLAGENSLPQDFPIPSLPVRHLLTNPRIFHVFLRHPAERGGEWLGAGADCFCFGGSPSSCEIVNWVERTIISFATGRLLPLDAGAQLFADFGRHL